MCRSAGVGGSSVDEHRLLGSEVLGAEELSEMNKDAQLRATINQKLIETGERERLKELLRAKLTECGWKDQLKAHCKDVIREKGLEHVTVDDLVAEITPKGRALVPDSVKKELLQRIRTFLSQHASL
ncbi:transcription and mRNA export factor ENY2 isoform X1 [Amblyraja radiata]|uniref:transcription and mRNA export factor ENY2 isoform X1 n=2 Tax=Elasmobranchii TaxID=7778 RepID=UPI00140229D3|nr:transcription and mRNA export factor ENY2 isoform X1 [Amblyraja radiata]XP_055490648.1 transcription and mRNA export factor ENY2 isoform X1 [Leucoraja erinacea]